MRRMQKQQAEEFVSLLSEAHEEIKRVIVQGEYNAAFELLEQCQEGAIRLGELVEATEGEGFVTIPLLEHYCELVYELHEEIAQKQLRNVNESCKILMDALELIRESIDRDIKVRLEIAFLPYKASMWDSLESIWKAADADESCDAYVVPIPYFDRNPDMSFGQLHYEGYQFPKNVPVTFYQDYDLENRRPDVIYIHNPYDEYNTVTSVHPNYYSYELKKYTDALVYVPYYSTTGGMSEGQRRCSAYYHADYIVTQAEKYRKFFDENIPDEKFLPFGSPKFDRVIHICENPPEPPAEWKDKIERKKVYFYNTSIGGMLEDTGAFLEKMKYVFACFEKNPQACLLWRPHPLLESTVESMRPGYLEAYRALKDYFLEQDLGIYDTTPDITNVVAWSDVYIGDAASSVVSLFGIAGKPVFILNNQIHSEPEEDDWRGEIIKYYLPTANPDWIITQGSKLYGAIKGDYNYRYYCDLSEYVQDGYYSQTISIGEREYACPAVAQDIIVLHKGRIEKKIELEKKLERPGAFYGAVHCGKYLFLIPNYYPALVRYDTETEEVSYIDQSLEVFATDVNGQRRLGGFYVLDGYLFLASPTDNRVLAVHAETMEEQMLTTNVETGGGYAAIVSDGKDLWLLPYELAPIVRWNPFTGEKQVYGDYPTDLSCEYMLHGRECTDFPFVSAMCTEEKIYIAPHWANMYLCLDKKSGTIKRYIPQFENLQKEKNGYFYFACRSGIIHKGSEMGKKGMIFSCLNRKLYEVELETGKSEEVVITFDVGELKKNNAGFEEQSQWLQYACKENAFNSLSDFLNGKITGNAHDREKQVSSYNKIIANGDGTCGKKVHEYICSKL